MRKKKLNIQGNPEDKCIWNKHGSMKKKKDKGTQINLKKSLLRLLCINRMAQSDNAMKENINSS